MMKVAAPALPIGEVLCRLSRGARPFLLDGAHDGDGLGRYTFAGCDPDDGLVWRRGDAGDPFRLLEDAQRRWSIGPVDDEWPIAVGYITYDAAAHELCKAHGRTLAAVDDLDLPGLDFARYRAVWRYDRKRDLAEVLAHDGASAEHLLNRLQRAPRSLHAVSASTLVPLWSKVDYEKKVERILSHLRAGDVYQVNLAQRLVARVSDESALALYLALRRIAPAPLGAYLATDAGTILSNSPEQLVRVEARKVDGRYAVYAQSRPIKGTRPRGTDEEDDAAQVRALEASEKDAAEHLMIVDLVRNDLGKVAGLGTVTASARRVLTLPMVNHLVSTIEAGLDGGTAELLASVLPGGSVTGAPKLAAVEIIDQLEGVARGVYCGALGWMGAGRALHLSLPIRTAVVKRGELLLSVGGGIVADSTPEAEWAETLVKARAFTAALS
ncbi:MAG: anthranilate synthase component I family protein [Polyangia bacterium]